MVYYDQLLEQLRSNVPKIPELKRNILEEINKNLSESIDVLMQELLRFYIKEILEQFSSSTKQLICYKQRINEKFVLSY